MTAPRKLITAKQVAEMTTLSTSFLYDHAKTGTGPKSMKLGRRRVWVEADVLAWIAEQQERAS